MARSDIKAGSAFVELLLKDEKFAKGLRDGQRKLQSFGKAASTVGASLLAVGGGTLTAFAGFGLKIAGEAEKAEVAFRVMLGSAEKAQKVLSDLKDFAASTPFEQPELVDAARKLIAFGTSAEELLPTLRTLGDVAAGVDMPIAELAEIFGKAKVAGRLFGEDINQLTGRGIPIIGEFAKQFGVAESEVKKLVEQGKIGFPQLQQAMISLTSEGGKFAGLMDAQSQTLLGKFSTMMDSIKLMFGEIGNALMPVAKEIGEALSGIIAGITEWAAANRGLIVIAAGLLAVMGGMGAVLMATGFAATQLAAGFGALVTTIKHLQTASLFLMANPMIAGLAAIAAGAVAAAVAINSLTSYTAELADEQAKALDAGDKQRQADSAAMDRLDELASKQSRTNAELQEAQEIIDQLTATYGDLGLSIDQTTGSINGMSEAQKALRESMRAEAIAEVSASLAEMENNISEYMKEAEAAKGFWANSLVGSGGEEAVQAAQKKAELERKKTYALQLRLARLRQGDAAAVTGEAPKPATATPQAKADDKAIKDAEAAAERMEQLEADLAAKRRTRNEQELQEIRELTQERLKLLDAIIAGEKAKAGGGDKNRIKELEGERQRIAGEEMQSVADAKKRHAVEEAEKKASEEEKKKAEAEKLQAEADRKAGLEQSNQDEIADLEIDADGSLSDKEKQLKKLELERQRALRDAAEQGIGADGVNRKYDLRKQLIEAEGGGGGDAKKSVFGSFSAAALQAAGPGTKGERLAKETRDLMKQFLATNKQVVDILRRGGVIGA